MVKEFHVLSALFGKAGCRSLEQAAKRVGVTVAFASGKRKRKSMLEKELRRTSARGQTERPPTARDLAKCVRETGANPLLWVNGERRRMSKKAMLAFLGE